MDNLQKKICFNYKEDLCFRKIKGQRPAVQQTAFWSGRCPAKTGLQQKLDSHLAWVMGHGRWHRAGVWREPGGPLGPLRASSLRFCASVVAPEVFVPWDTLCLGHSRGAQCPGKSSVLCSLRRRAAATVSAPCWTAFPKPVSASAPIPAQYAYEHLQHWSLRDAFWEVLACATERIFSST